MGGDGNVCGNEISFSLKDSDVGLVAHFRRALQIGNPVRFDQRTKEFGGYRFQYRRAVVSVCSRQLANDLATYGVIPAKTGRTKPALIPEQVQRRLERHYWRGWVDTDGWLVRLSEARKRQQLILGLTGDPPVVRAFREFCMRYVPTKAGIHPNNNIKRFVVTDSYALRIARLLYEDATISLERKRSVYLTWKAARPDWLD